MTRLLILLFYIAVVVFVPYFAGIFANYLAGSHISNIIILWLIGGLFVGLGSFALVFAFTILTNAGNK